MSSRAYRASCKGGQLAKRPQMWVSNMENIQPLLALIQAVKHNDFVLYAVLQLQWSQLYQMLDIFCYVSVHH